MGAHVARISGPETALPPTGGQRGCPPRVGSGAAAVRGPRSRLRVPEDESPPGSHGAQRAKAVRRKQL